MSIIPHDITAEMNAGRQQQQAEAAAGADEARKNAETHLTRHGNLKRENLHSALHNETWINSHWWPKVPGHGP